MRTRAPITQGLLGPPTSAYVIQWSGVSSRDTTRHCM